jgi:hypothetical protein
MKFGLKKYLMVHQVMRNREKRREMITRKLSSTCFTDEQYFNEAKMTNEWSGAANSAGAVLQLQQSTAIKYAFIIFRR